MIPRSRRYYNPKAKQRVAAVAVEATDQPNALLLRLERGVTVQTLAPVRTAGPFPADQLPAQMAEAEKELRADGYLPAGVPALLAALRSTDSTVRARAATRLGLMRARDAVEALLAIVPDAVDDVCSILDALGNIGDARAVPVLRQQAARKLLSRRRSAVEALRNLNDAAGLAQARQQALERLPASVRQTLEAIDENAATGPPVQTLMDALLALDEQQQGMALDTLYELATPAPVAAVRGVLRQVPFDRPHRWRYVKSVWKRACLRHDYVTFGEVIHTLEAQGRTTTGNTATVKSGYDGVQRKTRIFGRKTQFYLRRAAWRYLRLLATHRPDAYAHAAAEAIVPYITEDAVEPQGLNGAFASCYLLQRVLRGGSNRFVLDDRRLRFRYRSSKQMKPAPGAREEAYPHLWDAEPRAYLRVLAGSRLLEVLDFAAAAIADRHMAVLQGASHAEVVALLTAPHEGTVKLGLGELERRFDPQRPDWALLQTLAANEHETARQLAARLLRLSAPHWTRDPELILRFLQVAAAELRPLLVELAAPALAANTSLRQTLARLVLALLRTPTPIASAHDGIALLARQTLLDELGAVLTVADLTDMIFRGSSAAQSVGAELLRHRPEAITELGLERLTDMAQHEVAIVRAAAHGLLRAAESLLRTDPAPLLVLVESDWADTRTLAFDLLRATIDPEKQGIEALLGLLDSNRVDVQDLGQELARQHFAHLKADDLVFRLVQHPHPHMRDFALRLATEHLPDGAAPLSQLQHFFRAALFDLWPQRKVKHGVIAFLSERGLRDPQQARVAASILRDVVRLQGRADFERALEALVRLKLAHPGVETAVTLREGGEA